jgi:serine/threonine-protein kinase HipA
MADTSVDVVVQIADRNVPAGRLWAHSGRGSESATFEYLPEYLARTDAYPLDPLLPMLAGQQQTPAGQALFGALSDAAPDGWGRRLIAREEFHRASEEHRTPHSRTEIDFLLGVRDDLRQGALRFRNPASGAYVSTSTEVPHLIELPRLLNAAEALERENESDEDLRLLVQGGSSLGGAQPKAHVRAPDGALGIAKFPAPTGDSWDVIRWEAVSLTLASRAGISVPQFALHAVAGRPVLIVQRFDRHDEERIGYVSAMTLLEAADGDGRSYVEIAEAIEEHSRSAAVDLRELWRRMVFSRLISNTDDHLRNHGFLRTSTAGWSLSPAFDLNPNPQPGGTRFSTVVDEGRDGENEVDVALDLASMFRLTPDEALGVLGEVVSAVSRWAGVAKSVGLASGEIDRMSGAFTTTSAEAAADAIAANTA